MIRGVAVVLLAAALACQSQPVPVPTAPPAPEPTEAPAATPTPRSIQLPTQQPTPRATPVGRLIHQTGQWKVVRTDYMFGSKVSHALIAGAGQLRVTCIFYWHELPVPRVNIVFAEELQHRLVQNEAGEWQGAVDSRTSIGDRAVSVEWLTWVTRADRLLLRGGDARALVRSILDSSAPAFRLELPDDPHLSRDYDVTGLEAAISEAELTCFR